MRYHLMFAAVAASTLLTSATRPVAATVQYAVTDLGAFAEPTSQARALNDAGQVVGTGRYPYLYSDGTLTNLGASSGASAGSAWAINNASQVAGFTRINGSPLHAFLYDHGTLTDLHPLLSNSTSHAYGINAAGKVVGDFGSSSVPTNAFLYANGTVTDLGNLGRQQATAYDINASDQIVGQSVTADGDPHAFLYENGSMTDLGTLGGNASVARAINDAGSVVGQADLPTSGSRHAFLYADHHMTDLGSLVPGADSFALGIGESGQIVGWSETTPGTLQLHAILYSADTMTDLNSLISPSSGWTLNFAYSINASGQIAGVGTFNGSENRGFLLTPTPEPATLSLVPFALLPLITRRSSRRFSNASRF